MFHNGSPKNSKQSKASYCLVCRKHAWGFDELNAASQQPMAWFNLGLTIVDSLDTLLLMNLMDEYQEARHWVANHLKFPDGASVQVRPGALKPRGKTDSLHIMPSKEHCCQQFLWHLWMCLPGVKHLLGQTIP
jgi:hypothetical protein